MKGRGRNSIIKNLQCLVGGDQEKKFLNVSKKWPLLSITHTFYSCKWNANIVSTLQVLQYNEWQHIKSLQTNIQRSRDLWIILESCRERRQFTYKEESKWHKIYRHNPNKAMSSKTKGKVFSNKNSVSNLFIKHKSRLKWSITWCTKIRNMLLTSLSQEAWLSAKVVISVPYYPTRDKLYSLFCVLVQLSG